MGCLFSRTQIQYRVVKQIGVSDSDPDAWIPLEGSPHNNCSNLIAISYKELIIAPWRIEPGPNSQNSKRVGLYKYNIITDRWSLFVEYPPNMIVRAPLICFCHEKHELFLYSSNGDVSILDLNSHTFGPIYKTSMEHGSAICCDNNRYHLTTHDREHGLLVHSIWDDIHFNLKEKEEFGGYGAFNTNQLVYIDTHRQIFNIDSKFIGANYTRQRSRHVRVVYYDVDTSEWTNKNVSVSPMQIGRYMDDLNATTAVATSNQQYIMIIGGSGLWLFNIDEEQLRWCANLPTKMSFRAPCSACVIDSSNVLLSGFVTQNCAQMVPTDVVKLISDYCSPCFGAYIHIVSKDDGQHWKLQTDSIMSVNFDPLIL
eukprot:1002556_1